MPFHTVHGILMARILKWFAILLSSEEIKRRLLLGRNAMTNLDSMLKSRDITLPTKVCLVKATVFPGVGPELDHKEGWVPKN